MKARFEDWKSRETLKTVIRLFEQLVPNFLTLSRSVSFVSRCSCAYLGPTGRRDEGEWKFSKELEYPGGYDEPGVTQFRITDIYDDIGGSSARCKSWPRPGETLTWITCARACSRNTIRKRLALRFCVVSENIFHEDGYLNKEKRWNNARNPWNGVEQL